MTTDFPNAQWHLPQDTGTRSQGAGLRRFAGTILAAKAAAAEERCEMCGEGLGREHPHLIDLRQRSISCACRACALLFDRPGARHRAVPDRVRTDPGAPLTEADWTALQIPVSVAFFFTNSDLGRVVASYPSPAGVTECELDLAAWERLSQAHPLLRAPEDDVEAILVVAGNSPGAVAPLPASDGSGSASGADTGTVETFLVPIDVCYGLAGALRMDWHGFDGGPEARRALAGILDGLRQRARALKGGTDGGTDL
jgi:hypothetical protein